MHSISALPSYIDSILNDTFAEAFPGHGFQMYYRCWRSDSEGFFSINKDARVESLKEICKLNGNAIKLLSSLNERQFSLITALSNSGYTRTALSTSPFATGLGNEHPNENGFAFLTPYGLPYLAGSGIKGVLRRAAEELAIVAIENPEDRSDAWTCLDIWWLFGFEDSCHMQKQNEEESSMRRVVVQREDLPLFINAVQSDKIRRDAYASPDGDQRFFADLANDGDFRRSLYYRGALDFWDCYPKPKENCLAVEIMTSHYSKYYQGEQPPHDAGQPVPVSFLALPPGSTFNFHVVCHSERLPEVMRSRWRQLLDAAFEHAYEWVGFGAKTSVGYGALGSPEKLKQKSAAPEVVWEKARLRFNPRNKNLTAIGPKNVEAHASAPSGEQLLQTLPVQLQQKVRGNGYVHVVATVCGSKLLSIKTQE
jgi:CRISPR-associated protein Cmr6